MIYLIIFPQIVNNIHTSATTLSQDLKAITNWAFQWKMIFNTDLSKQAQEVIFSRKIKKLLHPTLLFNNIPFSNSLFQKHLRLALDATLNFSEHIKSITKEISKTMGLLRKFQQILPRSTLLNSPCFESTLHFFLHCPNFLISRQTLFQKIRNIDDKILSQSETQLTQTLLYGSQNYHPGINRLIINSTIKYIISTGRFRCSLFN